jgi:SAM-dependent methyltransferase
VAALGELLPFASGTFDRALSTLMLHHLTRNGKRVTLREALRVLRRGGELHLADWGRPHTTAMRIASRTLCSFEHAERTADNVRGRIPQLCVEAGFSDVRSTCRFQTLFGTLELLAASKH